MIVTASDLIQDYGYWEDHPDYPRTDWFYEATNNNTRLGYWEWVAEKIRTKEGEKK